MNSLFLYISCGILYGLSGIFFYIFLNYHEKHSVILPNTKSDHLINIIISSLYPLSAFTLSSGMNLNIAPTAE